MAKLPLKRFGSCCSANNLIENIIMKQKLDLDPKFDHEYLHGAIIIEAV